MKTFVGLTGMMGLAAYTVYIVRSCIVEDSHKPVGQIIRAYLCFTILLLSALGNRPNIGIIITVTVWITSTIYETMNISIPKSATTNKKSASFALIPLQSKIHPFLRRVPNWRKAERVSYLINRAYEGIDALQFQNHASQFVKCFESLKIIVNEIASYSGNIRLHDDSIDLLEPQRRLAEEEANCQWYLRNAIERQKKAAISRLPQYTNSKEHKEREYTDFCRDIQSVAYFFSDESKEFADNAAEELYRATKLYFPKIILFPDGYNSPYTILGKASNSADNDFLKQTMADEENWRREMRGFSTVDNELYKIDHMDGHAFEYWCADLLCKIGFVNVLVTQRSKDHGGDVLAQKDGVTYAVQCKCYSSAIGNSAVQQAGASREIYKTHVGVAMTNNYFTRQAKEDASAMKIILWDRDNVRNMIEMSLKRDDEKPKNQKDVPITEEEIELRETVDDE